MRLQRIVISLFCYLVAVRANQVLECDFAFLGNDYACYIKNANITSATDPLVIVGNHYLSNTNANVAIFRTQLLPHSIAVNHLHPSIFTTFPNLRLVSLLDANLRYLELENCAGLTSISLWLNTLTSISSNTFRNCANLTTLDISNNDITTTFEDSFRGLTNLRSLTLLGNKKIDIFRNSLTDSSSYSYLYFSGNGHIEPGALSHMTSLSSIHISNYYRSDFQHFEELLTGLDNILSIYLPNNQFEEVNFEFLSRFSRLSTLWLHNNKLTSLPAGAFKNMSMLISLSLNSNKLSTLNEDTFTGLQASSLYLDGNGISDLSRNPFGNLTKLTVLSLHNNNLKSLTNVIFPPNLRTLEVGNNQITHLDPQTFTNLPYLNTIALPFNQIYRLNSNTFENLRNITHIDMTFNLLDEIEPNFFDNFPNIENFNGRLNRCIDENVLDMKSVDLDNENVFSTCFYNWQYGTTTTTTDGSEKQKISLIIVLTSFLTLLSIHSLL